ncbi:MAG: phosphonate ABC transporter, permease protein PhnE [Clostridia bacterium]|nr:phosphonate ABC transporter, permease protein PhnE [Clostridia bacterium]
MKIKDTVHFQWYKTLFVVVILAICLIGSIRYTNADFKQLAGNIGQVSVFLRKLANPDFKYLNRLLDPMVKTLKMSALGTVLGVLLAIPFAFMATTVVTDNPIVTHIFRFFLNIIRTIPNLLLAALLVAIIGIGEATGVITIAIFTFGVTSQLIFESIETIDLAPLEAAMAVGANKLKIAVWAVWPQVTSSILSYTFYAFELNVRASTVLGYVGAGGIGVKLNEALGLFRYERVSIIILFIFVVVVIVDAVSEAIRRRLK